ncbi:2-hydroxychromene-2-carboxylate isomerase [Psychromarinibacter sp. C21-152]|uniref:2-hydroxychromene-2-carboxylate isomerase n=1 Tax=Psychromarinibacter sediminicola TaxID=3033385 RepID=A0AAE3NJW8_9RHOB|nr:2-hydroxychromene-2-carboxylate isomerase [Psychromarinibacter sediminicola]MDF0599193.1 2-hydroxychromene-2-carboxylate isomerase [Psychromarinibacter sediminicola]
MTPIEFWYSIGSTYSYLTVMRLGAVARAEGLDVTWRPFNVRAIMVAQNNIPFRDKPVKAAYMWRDIERRAAKYGLPVQVPAPYPLAGLEIANRVALVGMEEGWGVSYTVETYRRWFQHGQPAGSEPNLSESVAAAGQDPERVLEAAMADRTGAALAKETATGEGLGVFGSPTFVVGGEVFWGDDRLDDAIAWARAGRLDA